MVSSVHVFTDWAGLRSIQVNCCNSTAPTG
jgi:hypothetical protein